MRQIIVTVGRQIRRHLTRVVCAMAAIFPFKWTVECARRISGTQLSGRELIEILNVINLKAPCNFLVFGVGYDTVLWVSVNRSGKTVFLESDDYWLRKIQERVKRSDIRIVVYDTRRDEWEKLLDVPEQLMPLLPSDLCQKKWDVILIDAPPGFVDSDPGRMQSIYAASRLASDQADIFVHDCDRDVERIYADKYLGPKYGYSQVDRMRHYYALKSSR